MFKAHNHLAIFLSLFSNYLFLFYVTDALKADLSQSHVRERIKSWSGKEYGLLKHLVPQSGAGKDDGTTPVTASFRKLNVD